MVRTPFWVRTRQRRKALRRSGHGAVSVRSTRLQMAVLVQRGRISGVVRAEGAHGGTAP
ncbi:hypothetical protein ERO13_A04G106601v2 [Gossypium hirsutum]|uniref:Uncharacterized protein n=2 Tax=Gossypium TaxID=3633 RepID=A0A5J5W8Y9_GOSBA|nr:hypothetical protein ES319_A04G128700v1 [Gossypium barbadense]KAG4205475.1 hypothetical protein ERO13_A04G106601v2 [Gossypium hirsutum]TYH22615.1 hypothetical protein ES288_A04G143100v1 [Gossypium darwinii]